MNPPPKRTVIRPGRTCSSQFCLPHLTNTLLSRFSAFPLFGLQMYEKLGNQVSHQRHIIGRLCAAPWGNTAIANTSFIVGDVAVGVPDGGHAALPVRIDYYCFLLWFTALRTPPAVFVSGDASRNYFLWALMHVTDMHVGICSTGLASRYARTAEWRRRTEEFRMKSVMLRSC